MKFSCERCGKKYATAETPASGRVYKIKCKACGHLIVVKASAGAATSATTEMRPPTLAGIPAAEPTPPRTPEHHPQATPDIQLEVAPPEPASPAPEPAPHPAADVGYVDLFEDGPKQETDKPAEDPFLAAARASLPDSHRGGAARPDPFAALREELSGPPALPTPAPRTPTPAPSPPSRGPSLPKIPAIPRPVLKKALLPVVLIVAGALVLVGILAYVLLGGSTPPPAPRHAQAPAPPRPPAPVAAEPPPAPAAPVATTPPPREDKQKAERDRRAEDDRRAREERREREAREREAREAREREAKEAREREARETREREAREVREREAREAREGRERERALREAREREARERDRLARDQREREAREAREAKERDRLAREQREREAREVREHERLAREQRAREEREARDRERQRRESEKVAAASSDDEPDSLSQGAIEKVLGATRKSFESCIVKSVGSGEVKLDGRRVMLRLNIQNTGAVTYPTLDDVTLNATELGSCLKNAARQMVFPRFKGDTMHIEVPLVLMGR